MHTFVMVKHISDDIFYIGTDDTAIDLFENQYPVPEGMSYNSYLICDSKIAILDTTDIRTTDEWNKNLSAALSGRTPDYLIVHHVEPDHSALVAQLAERYPALTIVASAKALQLLKQFFPGSDFSSRSLAVREGDELCLGRHTLRFMMSPMVHWPEVMVSYDTMEHTLFSADAFGKFGALSVTGFDDEQDSDWACEARRYYFNICGKYGVPVQALLKKVNSIDIQRICPLHGPMLSSTITSCVSLYDTWSSYKAEKSGVLIAHASIHGGTAQAALQFAKMLEQMGVVTAKKGECADICLINTCSVTEVADHKCRQTIHRMVRHIDGVDLVLGSNEKANLIQFLSEGWVEREKWREENQDGSTGSSDKKFFFQKTKDIKSFTPSCSRGNRTRYFLKVQDGCDYFCTYCTIPFARGFSRNPSVESLVEQARNAAAEGGKEIVLTGVNIGDFGKTTGERFIDLVKALDDIEGIQRYRISSLEPNLISDELIELCARSRAFMPHFHIPLQSGSDEVLRLMHRHYDSSLFAEKIRRIKDAMPDAFIGVDVMVGCRGETPECFEETYGLLNELDVTQLHVFPYSERPGTAALKIDYKVSDKDKKLRSKRLLELSDRKTERFYAEHIGHEAEVLFEKSVRGRAMHGFTRNYVRVELSAAEARPELDNEIVSVRLGEFNHDKTALKAIVNKE